MQNQDEFDEPSTARALGSILSAFDMRERFEARKPAFATAIVVALIAVLASVIWYSYPREAAQREVINTPIVRADASAYRAEPEERGGMVVPYRESTVFNTLRDGDEGDRKVENLLPQPEQPVSRKELFAGLKVEEPAIAAVDEAVAEKSSVEAVPEGIAKVEAPAVAPVETPAVVEAVAEKAKPEVVAEINDAVKANKTEPAAGVQIINEKTASTKASTGGFYVQLGSVRSRDGAQGEWKKMQKSFAALGSLDLRVQEADLGAKGMFYRIQGGPVSEAQAKSICQSITNQKPGGCLVVRQ